MAEFVYVARDKSGKVFKGSLEAENERTLRTKVRALGYYPTRIIRKKKEISFAFGQRIRPRDLVVFITQLAAMINAGLPIMRCLSALEEQSENKRLGKIIGEVRLAIEGGSTLSDALAKYPKIFSHLFVNLAQAGEAGGILDEVLLRFAHHADKEQEMREKVRGAFAYPAVVSLLALVVVTFLLLFIVPVFASVYARLRVSLPLPTLILVGASRLLIHSWWAILIVVGGMILGYRRYRATERGALTIDRLKLRLPIFGNLIGKSAVSRFIRTLGALVASGVPIIHSLGIGGEVTGNRVVTTTVSRVEENVRRGGDLTGPMRSGGIFPPMVIQMVAAGEESGTLPEMLEKSATFLDRDVDYTVKRLVTLLEPLLIVCLALLVGFIALAIYLPMFELIHTVG